MIPPAPRSGRIWIERTVEQRAVRELGFADSGLLHRVWMDVAHRPRIVRLAAGEVRLEAWQALVSVSEYAREAGCKRDTVRAGLSRLAAAGWISADSGPHGTVVGCLIRPSGEDVAAPAEQPATGQGGGPESAREVAPNRPGGWPQIGQGGGPKSATTVNTPAGATPAGQTPAGPQSCTTGVGSYPDQPRARDNVVAAMPRPAGSSPAAVREAPAAVPAPVPARPAVELHPVTAATCRAAGVPPGEALELVCRGHDEARVLGRALQLAAKLRTGFRPRSNIAWLRDKVARGPGAIELHETAKRMLGRCGMLPLGWLPAQAPAETASVGDVLRRAAAGGA